MHGNIMNLLASMSCAIVQLVLEFQRSLSSLPTSRAIRRLHNNSRFSDVPQEIIEMVEAKLSEDSDTKKKEVGGFKQEWNNFTHVGIEHGSSKEGIWTHGTHQRATGAPPDTQIPMRLRIILMCEENMQKLEK